MATREQMTEQTKRALVMAAIKLFAQRSYEHTSVGDISAAAGVTKGAFYHHYASKEDLLHHIQEAAIDRVIEESGRVVAKGLTAAETLAELIRIQLVVVAEHRDSLLSSVSERKSLDPGRWRLIRSKRDQIEALITQAVQRGQDAGEFAGDLDPKLAAYGVLGMCYWSSVWFRSERRGWKVGDIADAFVSLALRGLIDGTAVEAACESDAPSPVETGS
jgi:AcrR family transcriptional regulator